MDMYRRRRRMLPRSARPINHTYKKILNFAPASRGAGTIIHLPIVVGVESLSPGQSSATDGTVPTGSVLTHIEIQFAIGNLAAAFCPTNIAIQYLLVGQTAVDPRIIGGHAQRNQVFLQLLRSTGEGQNQTFVIKFKIPKRFSRIRESMSWQFSYVSNVATSDAVQVIYKFQS